MINREGPLPEYRCNRVAGYELQEVAMAPFTVWASFTNCGKHGCLCPHPVTVHKAKSSHPRPEAPLETGFDKMRMLHRLRCWDTQGDGSPWDGRLVGWGSMTKKNLFNSQKCDV